MKAEDHVIRQWFVRAIEIIGTNILWVKMLVSLWKLVRSKIFLHETDDKLHAPGYAPEVNTFTNIAR